MPPQEFGLLGNTAGLPKTQRSGTPYEIEPITLRESWGAGNGSLTCVCRQLFTVSPGWIRDMVGEIRVIAPLGGDLLLTRFAPERYPGVNGGDRRLLYCSGVDQTGAGDLPESGNGNFANGLTLWPETLWRQYRATFEAFPFKVLTDTQAKAIVAAASPFGGAAELTRYIVRTRRSYSKEQPLPAGAVGFRDTTTGKKIGQVGFRSIGYADVTYKWLRVPLGFPPPVGWIGFTASNPWPPPVGLTAADPRFRRARDSFLNTVNDDWFDVAAPDGYSWPPGTLLYTGYSDDNRYFDAAGDWVSDVTFTFKAKMGLDSSGAFGGWNYALNSAGKWVYVNLEGAIGGPTDTPPYQANSFDDLFQYS